MQARNTRSLSEDLVWPTLLFAAIGAMAWAVRGSSGFGGENGCIFAGVMWGTAWWFLSREPTTEQPRRYSSGWIILALTVGIGISGARGWMQWSSFFDGYLQTNTARGEAVPISRHYGFIWLFIAGVPWAGLGACMLAWCGSSHTRVRDWVIRLAFGLGAACVARSLFEHLPEVFLPLYEQMKGQYADLGSNPNLRRLINDNREAITHLGLYLGFLTYEAVRRDWRNVLLIASVGLLNGVGWALCQNWKWAPRLWPNTPFNWWRCWESCGGISIGLAYGLAYFLVNRRQARSGQALPPNRSPRLERWGAYFGLVFGLGLSLRNGLKGWANIYLGNEAYWDGVLWLVFAPLLIAASVWVSWRCLRWTPRARSGDLFPHASWMIWLVLVTQNVIAQLVTGPRSVWSEMVFSLYYALMFALTGVIVHHVNTLKTDQRPV